MNICFEMKVCNSKDDKKSSWNNSRLCWVQFCHAEIWKTGICVSTFALLDLYFFPFSFLPSAFELELEIAAHCYSSTSQSLTLNFPASSFLAVFLSFVFFIFSCFFTFFSCLNIGQCVKPLRIWEIKKWVPWPPFSAVEII